MAENTVTCSCCDRAVATAVPLQCHAEIAICPDCIGWLRREAERLEQERAGITPRRKRVIFVEPIFTVADVARAEAHYRRLGFETEEHDATYAFARRDNASLHLALADGDGRPSQIYLHVDDADALAAGWRAAGVEVEELIDTDYGKRESAHTDPDGNRIRFGSALSSD
jgi:catechol 2,3-dioxygenase-like lactoylglutathione lyase family enzyme